MNDGSRMALHAVPFSDHRKGIRGNPHLLQPLQQHDADAHSVLQVVVVEHAFAVAVEDLQVRLQVAAQREGPAALDGAACEGIRDEGVPQLLGTTRDRCWYSSTNSPLPT